MNRFALMMLVLFVMMLTVVPAYADDGSDAAVLSALQASFPGLQTAVIDQWGDTAAAVMAYQGDKALCILDRQEGTWRITLQNPHVLVQEEPLPSLLLDTDTALFWSYPTSQYSASKTNGIWNTVVQTARTMTCDGEVTEDEIVYRDGEIVHTWFLFDENENMLEYAVERVPAPWLSDCANLADFDIDRFPVMGAMEYEGQWPSRAFMQQAASYLMPSDTFVSGSYSSGRLRFLMEKPDDTLVFVGCGTGVNPALTVSSPPCR